MAEFKVNTYIKRAAVKKKELAKFMRKVAKSRKHGLHKATAEADVETWKEVACLDCANCCKKMTPTYTTKDINRIARHLNITYKEYFDKYLKLDTNKDIINKSTPCHFLGADHKCSIYEIRPVDCSGFPHFTRKDFRYQAEQKTILKNIDYCPASLVFLEKLEAKIGAGI